MTDITWALRTFDIADLTDYYKNPRSLSKAQFAQLKTSLDKFGMIDKPIVNLDKVVIGGHQRLHVLRAEGVKEVECWTPSRMLTEKEVEELNIRLNVNQGSWDFDILANQFEESDLIDWGFTDEQLKGLDFGDTVEEDPGAQIDKAAELQEKWQTATGQLWRLGEHRLICGDCTDASIAGRLLQGDKIDMVQIDPPYGVDYSGQKDSMFYGHDVTGKPREKIQSDNSVIGAMELLDNALTIYKAPVYFVWHAPQFGFDTRQIIDAHNIDVFAVIVWNKNHANFGARGATYKPKYEMAFACKTEKIPFYGPDNEVTVWDIDRSSKNEFHPTQKPVELFERAIRNHTRQGEIVADFFCGGGTTLIACERLGRKCRAIEISPAYVAVAIQRWADMTGGAPELIYNEVTTP